ncbi:hypothetical protein [Agrilutibacter solisilvae]|uniref:Uncharacterized protein n=1 Tax=Agrilutibacter solisilvae TaxID=2763317 RepID=A0A975ARH1_9GAMM|nr:hypothetical protein [Lysobacter solisilvae]QSX77869.1 hypothetical protein I8J32_014240 [Lysobacter solisilvae]
MARTPPPDDRTFRRKEPDSRLLTSQTIADHLKAFESSGGHIEVLGVTHVLKKLEIASPGGTPLQPNARATGRRP